jgi:chemotaxis protein CheZ
MMDIRPQLHTNEIFIKELQDCAKLLSEKLSSDDIEGASELIEQLVRVRDDNMYLAVGQLTRGLHSAITSFNVDGDFDSDPPNIESSEIKDASTRLNYVIEMTQNAADKTMDMVEAAAPIALNLGQEAAELHQEWARLKRREMTADEFRGLYTRIDRFLDDMREGTGELNKNLQGIILEQGFQDLTGQVLKRVIGLICDVEVSLVELVRIASQVEVITGLSELTDQPQGPAKKKDSVGAEGPQIHSLTRSDVVSNQDEVDDLLSSLGF